MPVCDYQLVALCLRGTCAANADSNVTLTHVVVGSICNSQPNGVVNPMPFKINPIRITKRQIRFFHIIKNIQILYWLRFISGQHFIMREIEKSDKIFNAIKNKIIKQ